jgi:SRSO17 transposase
MPRIEDTPALSTLAATEATASPMAGGPASMAAVARRLAPYCARSPYRHWAQASLQGWLREAERHNSWQVAEVGGASTPKGFQDWLRRADGDAAAGRDELRLDVLQQLGDANGVLVLDETGLRKTGEHSAGGARQYSGTAGTVEHCPIGVLLRSARPLGHALRDRALSLSTAWTEAGARCRPAGLSADRPVATTPPLAQPRLNRAVRAGGPATWGTGDRI